MMAMVIWMVTNWLLYHLHRLPAMWVWCRTSLALITTNMVGIFTGHGIAASTVIYVETVTHTPSITAVTTIIMPPAVTETVTVYDSRHVNGQIQQSVNDGHQEMAEGAEEVEYVYIHDPLGL